MKSEKQATNTNENAWPWSRIAKVLILTSVVSALVAFGLTALLINIFERKQEAKNPFFRVVELTDDTGDPAIWGKNFPQQYDLYKRTTDMVRTRFGGSEAMPRTPTEADPRSVVAQSKLEEDPRLKIMWAGYAFSRDYREERGHAYMLEDQMFTERQKVAPQPGACLHCHASMYIPYKKVGDGDIMKGFAILNKLPYPEAKAKADEVMAKLNDKLHPVACIDCHDPNTMQLRITRPAFINGIRALKEHQGVKDYDVNKMATRQEMRAYVCAQCHVEYYFKGPDKQLTYPWHDGIKADEILAYYDRIGFKDWTHKETSAPALKAQHPEFELWSQGVHARAGVACADCHMPYKRVGAMKISDHHVRSPLLNIANACQTCHKFPEEELKARAEQIQERTAFLRNVAMDALMDLIADLKAARAAGLSDEQLSAALMCQRRAQFLLDFVESENSTGFHAPQEAARVLGLSLDYSRQGQVAVRSLIQLPNQKGARATTSTLTTAELPAPPTAPSREPSRWQIAGLRW
ncbi:MAG: ammonia-forming cytochrome c nitrite reductase subunit c552 [Candidatus Hydrogenedentota bacterium]|uniref:nitrite reductase (cytochrome; ammonia-forming) n=1 Tax=Sumerlaea chitinivorans TaxID=2250252 RepID=A0A2Z4Y138_SUMC1|nr:Cytochrome c nitrite reductase subunit NrfA [Candidatus Sumerlaea chitinivorans]MCX7962953.1 ammonia-forming cytochrome c nitrite reductase subunit c552 [Candidatus Sumerlaea chitinivorans]RMH23813.1 MAG: ammonia-forming cytochrome c nitrite reductase subunit c552 [Candidatus Hydrogenedentota bacterium]